MFQLVLLVIGFIAFWVLDFFLNDWAKALVVFDAIFNALSLLVLLVSLIPNEDIPDELQVEVSKEEIDLGVIAISQLIATLLVTYAIFDISHNVYLAALYASSIGPQIYAAKLYKADNLTDAAKLNALAIAIALLADILTIAIYML